MSKTRELTGWKVFAIFAGGFGTIIAVNFFMAFQAVSTFPGVDVEKSYAHSQTFNDRRAAQQALGWNVDLRVEGGEVLLDIADENGNVVRPAELRGLFGVVTHKREDQQLQWVETRTGYAAPIRAAANGNWLVKLEARADDGTPFAQRIVLYDVQG